MIDLHRLGQNTRALIAMGLAFAAMIVAVCAYVIADFSGAFSGNVRMIVQLPPAGSIVADDSQVTYRDVKVGQVVRSIEPDARGIPQVEVEIFAEYVDTLPTAVTATVGPVSIFGNQYIQLLAPEADSGTGLRADAVIPVFNGSEDPSLQTTFVALNDLLRDISPAKLNAGLSGLSNALEGQGKAIGNTVVEANQYVATMIALWPTLVLDLDELAQLSRSFYDETPEFLKLIGNAITTSESILENESSVKALFRDGSELATTASALLSKTTEAYGATVEGATSMLEALSQSPDVFTRMLIGIDHWSRAWAPVLKDGTPKVKLESLRVRQPANLTLALVAGGSPDSIARQLNAAIRPGFAHPPTYAGCPQSLCRLRAGGVR